MFCEPKFCIIFNVEVKNWHSENSVPLYLMNLHNECDSPNSATEIKGRFYHINSWDAPAYGHLLKGGSLGCKFALQKMPPLTAHHRSLVMSEFSVQRVALFQLRMPLFTVISLDTIKSTTVTGCRLLTRAWDVHPVLFHNGDNTIVVRYVQYLGFKVVVWFKLGRIREQNRLILRKLEQI